MHRWLAVARAPEGRVGASLLADALAGVHVDRRSGVAELARLGPDGRTVLLDAGLPMVWSDGLAEVDVDGLLVLHERIEHALRDAGFGDEAAHAIAESAERRVVEEVGASWIAYRSFLEAQLRRALASEGLPGASRPAARGASQVLRHAACRRRQR